MVYDGIDRISLEEESGERKSIYINNSNGYRLASRNSEGSEKKIYDDLCEKHNDMTYLRDFVIFDGYMPFQTNCLGVDFLSIDITSDSSFDDEHPASVSLGDIVTFSSYSLKPYIDSGYKNLYDNDVFHPVVKRLSELTTNDLILLGGSSHGYAPHTYICELTFDSEPILSKTHTFTVTMTADDGRVFSDSIEMTF
jgi:hypothetical protein